MSVSSTGSTSSSLTSLLSQKTRIGGLVSGMDTDTLVEQLTSVTRGKITKQQQLKQKVEWQQELYRSIISKMTDFSSKYFSYANSSTNILSSTFFSASTIQSSSSLVTATGSTSNVKSMVIKNISALASQASFTSSKTVSDEKIQTGAVESDWIASNVAGMSLTIGYGGSSYTIKTSGDFYLDRDLDPAEAVDAVIAELNKQIENTTGLKGNVKFENIDGVSGTVRLCTTDESKTVALNAYKTSSTDIDAESLNFLTALGFTSEKLGTAVEGSIGASTADASRFYDGKVEKGSSIDFTIDGIDYTLTLDSDIDLRGATDNAAATAIASALQEAIEDDASLKDKLTVSADESGNILFEASGGGTLSVTGGSENLTTGLGLKSVDGEGNVTYSAGGAVDREKLVSSYLGDALAGSTLTFTLNGIGKTVTFNESEKSQFDTPDELAAYLQDKLDSVFGSGKIVAAADENGALSFVTTDPTSVLSLNSSDNTKILNKNGALRMNAGESNRVETTKTLAELESEISGLAPNENGEYSITVNGKDFTFSKDTALSKVISTINNDADAGIFISYSKTTDTFSVSASDSGAQGKVEIADKDGGGSLASSLFGTKTIYNEDGSVLTEGDYTVKNGTDAHLQVSFDGGNTFVDITRTENSFSLDDVNLTLTGLSTDPEEEITFSVNNNVDDLCTKIVDFVNEYNKIIDAVNTLVKSVPDSDYQPLTDEEKEEMTEEQISSWEEKAKKGLLQGDSTLKAILSDMRSAMSSFVESTGTALYQIGISTQSYDYTSGGQLTVDTEALKEALTENADQVMKMFIGEDGISNRVKAILDKNVGTYGGSGVLISLAGKENSAVDQSSLTQKIENYDEQIEKLKDQLETEEDRYWSKFTAMEQALSVLNQQSSWLTSLLTPSS